MVRIVCEGADDEEFIIKLLQHLKIKDANYNFDENIQNTGGKSHLLKVETYVDNLTTEMDKISKVLFIFDADFEQNDAKTGGMDKSIRAIDNLITTLNWKAKIDYHIFENNLDDFIISTLNKKQCFEKFDECLGIIDKNKNKKISTCIYRKLYPQAPYDFEHPNFDELKQKLIALFQ